MEEWFNIKIFNKHDVSMNGSALCFVESTRLDTPIVNSCATIFSPISFGSSAGNKSSFYCHKRSRSLLSPGYCYKAEDGEQLAEWDQHINDNFSLLNNFTPRWLMFDRQSFRERNHLSENHQRSRINEINHWLQKLFQKKDR